MKEKESRAIISRDKRIHARLATGVSRITSGPGSFDAGSREAKLNLNQRVRILKCNEVADKIRCFMERKTVARCRWPGYSRVCRVSAAGSTGSERGG